MSSEKKIFYQDIADDNQPQDMQTNILGDITKLLFYVKHPSVVIIFNTRNVIFNFNETETRSRKELDVSYSVDFGENNFRFSFRCLIQYTDEKGRFT